MSKKEINSYIFEHLYQYNIEKEIFKRKSTSTTIT